MLIEVLVAGLVFAFGVLGVVGLHAYMSKQQVASKYRAEATYLAGELIGTMWSDQPNLDQYATDNCPSHARCKTWSDKVAALLPSGTYEVTVDSASGAVTIEVRWTTSQGESQRYRTQTSVVIV